MKYTYFIIFILISSFSFGQRFAVVDTKYILENLEEYKTAELTLEKKVSEWADEILRLEKKLEADKLDLANKKILLTEEQFEERTAELLLKEENIKKVKFQRYSADGDIVKLRINLVVPIQNKIFNTVKLISEREKYAFVFDKSSDLVMIYSDPKTNYDITNEVLHFLKPKAKPEKKEIN